MLNKIKSWFSRNDEEETAPYQFALIELNPLAKDQGINDSWNKLVIIYEGGMEVDRKQYSPELVEALRKEMPVVEDIESEEDKYNFISQAKFGIINYKK